VQNINIVYGALAHAVTIDDKKVGCLKQVPTSIEVVQ